ncbi:Aste57867_13272 [Aphanomyces stellatus]|uniref:Aste57867_13272 protein n=1 Tax=Aphanomyces stellatus TaxID=120398 RepID=A0A485KZE2_9STRA|nr:hypothetical protein As57867_013223 [Aphanomyces stellatus]VFT90111.1 Aste57867_13272 [Aphanomyces stellatus]
MDSGRLTWRQDERMTNAAAATLGVLVTSLFVTPLEVAKWRLHAHAQGQTLPSFKKPTTRNASLNTFFVFSDGRFGRTNPKSTTRVHASPVEPPPIAFTRRAPPPIYLRGLSHALGHILRTEGPAALYAGHMAILVVALPSTVLSFISYDVLLARMTMTADHPAAAALPFFCGSVSGCVAAVVAAPLELPRVRMYGTSFVNTLVRSVARDGVFSLWRGLLPALARDVPFSTVYWGVYELLKSQMHTSLLPQSNDSMVVLGDAFVAGAAAGAIATSFVHPLEVVRLKCQAQFATSNKSRMFLRTVEAIVQVEGLGGLMKGWSARAAQVAPACAIMISTYEASKQYFRNTNDA